MGAIARALHPHWPYDSHHDQHHTRCEGGCTQSHRCDRSGITLLISLIQTPTAVHACRWTACIATCVSNVVDLWCICGPYTISNGSHAHLQNGPGIVYITMKSMFGTIMLLHSVTPLEPFLQKFTLMAYSDWWIPTFIVKWIVQGYDVQVCKLIENKEWPMAFFVKQKRCLVNRIS